MKTKLTILVLLTFIAVTGCMTAPSKDREMLQKRFYTVYPINEARYVTIDSVGNVFDVRVSADGKIRSTVEIR